MHRSGWWLVALGVVGCVASDDVDGDAVDTDTPADGVPFAAPDGPGPYAAGVDTFSFVDHRGKTIKMEVWYPAKVAEGREPDGYDEIAIAISAFRQATPDRSGAPYPVVAFSHGLGGIRFQSASITEHLASHGFVVVAPDHEGHILLFLDDARMGQIVLERPGDIMSAVDEIQAMSDDGHPKLGGMVDATTYGMLGHSMGAITTLAISGGGLDYQGALDHCADHRGDGCRYLGDIDPDEIDDHVLVDERVVAAVPMSPGVWYAFGEDGSGLSSTVESLVLGGTVDTVLDYDTEIRPVYEGMGAPKAMATLANTGHYAAYSDMCIIADLLGDRARDCAGEPEGFFDPALGLHLSKTLVTAFFKTRVVGDVAYQPWLEADYTGQFEALSWDAEVE